MRKAINNSPKLNGKEFVAVIISFQTPPRLNPVLTYGTPLPVPATVSIRTVMRYRANPEFNGSCNCVTDGVHYRESAGTGPVVLKVAQ